MLRLYETHFYLINYRRRPNTRNLRQFANGVVDLYLLCEPKIDKIKKKDRERIKSKLEGIERYLVDIPTDLDPVEWSGYFLGVIDAIEAIGVTKIMMPSTRDGYEMLEGTVF